MHVNKDARLIKATQAGDVAAVRKLLDKGADPRARDALGRTALHHAASNGQTMIAVRLLMHGVDPLDTYDNRSAIDIASSTGHQQLALILSLASQIDLNRTRILARSVSASPTYPTDRADRLIVSALLNEKSIDGRFEPLVTALLQEIRNEKPKPKRAPPPRNRSERSSSDASSASVVSTSVISTSRTERFTGVPPESVGNRTWRLFGSDSAITEIAAMEKMFFSKMGRGKKIERGDYETVFRRADRELDRVRIGSGTARNLLNQYHRRIRQSSDVGYWESRLRAAIMLYTDDRFYHILNKHWRNQTSGKLAGFSTLMNEAYYYAPYFLTGEVYRGVDLTDVGHYQKGLIFRWPFFVSASMKKDVAKAFGKTLVTIEVVIENNVRQIDNWSLFPEEAEVLFPAYEVFEVLESGPGEVRLRIFEDGFFGSELELNKKTRQVQKIV
jgi:hypothetical protein